jgi:hypothetical protein
MKSVHKQTTHDRRAETFHSSRNCSCATKNVGACRTLRRGSECVSGKKDFV